jgi:hypothetical protein
MPPSLVVPAFLAATCVGPYCGPDTDFERPTGGLPGDAGAPALALAADGAVLLAWEHRAGGARDIYVNRREPAPDGDWLPEPRRVDTDAPGAARSLEVRVAAGAANRIYAVWQDARNGRDDLYLNRSSDGGRTWEAPDTRLDEDSAGAAVSSMPALRADRAGRVYVAWEDQRFGSRDILFRRSTDHGATWDPERRVDTDPPGAGVSYHPQIVAWDDGTVLVCWWDERDGLADLYFRRSLDEGATWEPSERRVDPGDPGAHASHDARISVRGDQVAVAWAEEAGRHGQLALRASPDRGATWGELKPLGRGTGVVPVARESGAPAVGWIDPPAAGLSGEKTSIGGRIVPLPIPVGVRLATAADLSAQRVSASPGPATLWLGEGGGRWWAARSGNVVGRGMVEVYRMAAEGGRSPWRTERTLLFGEALRAAAVPVTAHSLVGAVSPKGVLHLAWVIRIGNAEELGFTAIAP